MQSEPDFAPRNLAPLRRWRPLFRALPARMPRRWRLAISCCLLGLLTGCAQQPQFLRPAPPPIPASLDRTCDEGLPIPDADAQLREVLEVWADREAAFTECRARVDALRRAWPR